MKEILTPFKVGLTVIVAFGLLIWMIGRVQEGIGDDPSGYRVFALFDDAGGMAEKSRVVIAGITVGQIDSIELEGDRAKVWILVNTPLKSDARIAKRQASLLGEYYLQLTPGYTGTPLKEGDEIKHIDVDVAPAELINQLKVIVDNVKEVTESARKVFAGEEGEARLTEILENINSTVAEVNRAVQANGPKVDRVVDNVEAISREARVFVKAFKGDARVIMADAKAVSRDARLVLANIRDVVGRNQGSVDEGFEGVKGAVTRLQSALDKLDETLGHTASIAGKIDDGTGSIGRLVNDGRLVDSATELVDESARFVKKLTRLQTIVGMRSDYYMSQSAFRNEMEIRLQPRPDKYYSIQLIDDPRGRTTSVERVVQTTASSEDPVTREQESVTDDRFRLSLLFAKRLRMFTGRVGIIEDSGGFGLDVHLFNERLELSTDMFGFDRNVNPRWRMWGMYTFYTHLYVAAGVDEIWNEDLTDVFVGVGLRFNDEDLKTILTAAPIPAL